MSESNEQVGIVYLVGAGPGDTRDDRDDAIPVGIDEFSIGSVLAGAKSGNEVGVSLVHS